MGDTCDNQAVTETGDKDETDACVTVVDEQNCSEMLTVLPPVSVKKGRMTKST